MASVKAWKFGDKTAPSFPETFEIVVKAVLQVTDIKSNHNKYYAIELHSAQQKSKTLYRVFTHYGRTDDLETNPDAGQKECRYFDNLAEARANYDSIFREKTSPKKGYKEVALASSKIGSQQARGTSSGEVDVKTLQKIKTKDDSKPVVKASELPIGVQELVRYIYDESKNALTNSVAAKITANGIETPLGVLTISQIEKGGYEHFMLKEIFEQPDAVRNAMRGRLNVEEGLARLGGLNMTPEQLREIRRIIILGCGTSWHAGLIGEYMLEEFARIPVEVEYASEFRYRNPIVDEGTLVLVISQSGETIDTLAAMREARRKGARALGIVNVVGSTMARESDGGVYIHAGPEIGVASTKAFTSQVTVLSLLTLALGRHRGMSRDYGVEIVEGEFAGLLALLAPAGRIVPQGGLIRLASHSSSLGSADQRLWERLEALIGGDNRVAALAQNAEGLRADQAQEAEVRAAQDRFGDGLVEGMAVREHQVEGTRRRGRDLGFDRLDADAFDVRRRSCGGEFALAFVDPLHAAGQAFEQLHDGAAHVAGAVELQMKARRGQRPGGERLGVEAREGQRHRAAAALAECGAERVVD